MFNITQQPLKHLLKLSHCVYLRGKEAHSYLSVPSIFVFLHWLMPQSPHAISSLAAQLGRAESMRMVGRISFSLHRFALCHWGQRVGSRGLLTAFQPSLRLPPPSLSLLCLEHSLCSS